MTVHIHELDVRPILKNGGHPFEAIMKAVEELKPGQGLRLLSTFQPQPLLRAMTARGYTHQAREIGNGDWEVIFTPRPAAIGTVDVSPDADQPERWPDPERHLDLTDLDASRLAVRILATADRMLPGEVLFALLACEPVFLFPDLEKHGHQWVGNFDETGEIYRILIRVGGRKQSGNA